MEKILFVMYNSLNKGGIQNVVINIIRHLHYEYQFDIFVLSKETGYYDSEIISYGGRIFREEFCIGKSKFCRSLCFYIRGRFLYKRIKQVIITYGPYKVIHCNIADEAGIAVLAARKCNVPIRIVHSHVAFKNNYNPIAKVYISFLKKLILKHATDNIACSCDAGKKLFGDNKFQVIYNTIEDRFLGKGIDRITLHNNLILLQIGTICDNKNQMFSLKILKLLKTKHEDARLIYVGRSKDYATEKYFRTLKMECNSLSLIDSVLFLPADSDVVNALENCTYVLFPSKSEGLGIVPIEAQARGVKCFISASVPRDVDCGGCIFLALDSGEYAWAQRIEDEYRIDKGAKNYYDISRFAPDKIMEQYRKLYGGNKQ